MGEHIGNVWYVEHIGNLSRAYVSREPRPMVRIHELTLLPYTHILSLSRSLSSIHLLYLHREREGERESQGDGDEIQSSLILHPYYHQLLISISEEDDG